MTTYPLPTLAATIDGTGISAPSYTDILTSLKASAQSIFGTDAYLDPDSQDGQLLAIVAAAINDANQTAISVYNQFSPVTAQGAGLSSVVKINGLARLVPTNSTADVTIVGQAGTVISNGIIGDNAGLNTKWSLPATVTIPSGGSVTVTATCQTSGAVAAASGTLTKILTPTLGWQSVTNPSAATLGQPVEDDATLRKRQAISTGLPAQTPLQSILAAVANVGGVGRHAIYENDTSATDSNGLPPHSIAVVAEGGDALTIATVISEKKSPGTATYGTTSETIIDPAGVPNTINFFQLTDVPLSVSITIKALPGYVSTTATEIINAVTDFINQLAIGEDSYLARLYSPSNLGGIGLGETFVVTAIAQSRSGSPTASDITIAFNEAASCQASSVVVTAI